MTEHDGAGPKRAPNMEKNHEKAYCCSRAGHADCRADVRSVRKCGAHVTCELLVRRQWLLTRVAATGSERHEAANRFLRFRSCSGRNLFGAAAAALIFACVWGMG